jgi:hypothetical protein
MFCRGERGAPPLPVPQTCPVTFDDLLRDPTDAV